MGKLLAIINHRKKGFKYVAKKSTMTGPLLFLTFSSKSSLLCILKMSIIRPLVVMPLMRCKLSCGRPNLAGNDFTMFRANMICVMGKTKCD